nr:GGDEF domain-containing phosphodiesterase [Anaerotignum lactatifermentans]
MILIVRRYKNKLFRFREYLETDEATGLGNQDYFIRKFDQLTNNKTKTLYQIVYFYVDYDHLYRICNREQADEFMRYCAEKIKERTQGNEVLARVADNGFSVLKFAGTAQDLHQWIITLFREIHAYSVKQGRPYDMSISVGVYPIKENDRNLREMLYNALECAQIARRGENLYLTCTDSLMRTVMEERYLQESMDKAFVNKEFQLYLQFYVEAGSFRVVGGEALSRWNHPQKGIIMPSVFVPLMEKEKMISRLDYYCLERVCEFLEHLWKKQIDSFFISCNFSRDTFSSADFVDQCKRIMAPFDFPKELLIFEITESAAAKSVAQVQENILALRSYGVRIALDDFGEGFSSFYDIQQYPIDGVKLDKGLVDDILSPSGSAIVRAMIQVGHELGMTILAEGVETEEQVYALQKMNCDVIQGFHFYVPLPYWDAEKRLLEEYQKRT